MKQMLDSGMIKEIRWCDTRFMLADVLTKAGAPLTEAVRQVMETNKMLTTEDTEKKK